ncbi:PREDICTED: factor of DNA methylation 4-like [Ipomoea nil]|uniref:factor of DNA methylation 4-like n=1 Tax=Ipomoea nil TaxID=35883 RepID=UPI0009011CC3|nr:PREDICTED: factor of DNA methylation 4-like [Ipomoea nil]
MPYRREVELHDCSNSKLEELKCRYYKDLRDGEDRIRGSGKYFLCPYCQDKRGNEYDMQGLLRHSYRIGYASKSSSLRDKARHLGLLKYLERHRYAESNARLPSPSDPSTQGADEETFVWPWMGIVANIPVVYKDGKFVDESGQKLKMELVAKGYNPVKVYTLLANRGFSGYAVVEFNSNFSGFANAMAFAQEFELDKHGKQEWYSSLKDESDDNLYAWIAGKEEYNSNSIVGDYLRGNGDLRTISEIQNENRKENSQLFSNLVNESESKYKECEETEKMISKTEVLMGNVMKEKEEMLSVHNKELEMIHQEALKLVETFLSEQETSKQQLDDHEKELNLREDEIRQCEKLNESEKMKLDCEKEMEMHRMKVKEKFEKCVKEKLLEICNILDIPIAKATSKKEDVVVKLMEFLEAPHATTSELLAEKGQSSKGKRKRASNKSGYSASGSSKGSAKSRKTESGSKKGEKKKDIHESENESEEEPEHEEKANGVSDRSEDEMSDHSDSDKKDDDSDDEPEEVKKKKPKSKKSVPKESEDESEEDKKSEERKSKKSALKDSDDESEEEEEKLKKKQISKKSSSKKESARKSKTKNSATPKKSTPPKKTPTKTSIHPKVNDGNDASPKASSKKKKTEAAKEKSSNSKKPASKENKGKKVVKAKDQPKKDKIKPTDDELRESICEILKEVDFNTATISDILKQLGKQYDTDITPRKSSIKHMIEDELTRLAYEGDDEEDELVL